MTGMMTEMMKQMGNGGNMGAMMSKMGGGRASNMSSTKERLKKKLADKKGKDAK